MPGSLIVKPVEANLTQNADPLGKMSPYCNFKVGRTNFKTQVCYKGGKHPHWNDALTLPDTQPIITVDLLDKDMVTHDEHIGSFAFDLREVRAAGQVSKWYPLYRKNKAVGEILLQAAYQPQPGFISTQNQSQYVKNASFYQEQSYTGGTSGRITNSQSQYSTPIKPGTNASFNSVEKQYYTPQGKLAVSAPVTQTQSNIWTEQVQVVTPRVFTKQVDVVETQTVLKEVEVMEPVKSLREVQFTKAVPVKKQIEVSRPEVVMKEIEVMEPRVITKTIQVVENVPVKREIQVVEMKNIVQEVETSEPQTFTKRVEVTEYKPVKKQMEVIQPVNVKKTVEFVEPVITTQTITKQQTVEPVIISTQVTETVGPASVIHASTEFSAFERERLSKLQRWIGYDNIFNGLNYEEKQWEQRRLSKLSEQEWVVERERLLKLDAEERLIEQRDLIQGEQDLDRSFVFTHSYKPSPNF